jgi:hypothetical protein
MNITQYETNPILKYTKRYKRVHSIAVWPYTSSVVRFPRIDLFRILQ